MFLIMIKDEIKKRTWAEKMKRHSVLRLLLDDTNNIIMWTSSLTSGNYQASVAAERTTALTSLSLTLMFGAEQVAYSQFIRAARCWKPVDERGRQSNWWSYRL